MIKRYSPVIEWGMATTELAEDGTYVTYEDHAAEVARLNEQVRALAAAAYEQMSYVLANEGIDVPDPKPEAVDAILRDVGARAVDSFGIYHNFSEKQLIQEKAKKYAARIRAGEVQP